MPRVKRGFKARRRRNRILNLAKGYRGAHGRLYRSAVEAVERGLCYAYRDRKQRKRAFRRLWIVRINAATRQHGLSYSKFINGLKQANVDLDRRVLAELAIADPAAFGDVVRLAQSAQS
jgi:large subunit ribosomal protein L20